MKNFRRYFNLSALVISSAFLVIACQSKTNSTTAENVETSPVVNRDDQEPTPPANNPQTAPVEEPSNYPQTTVEDAGVKADAATKPPTNQTECLAVCENLHPEGKLKADKIATCWTDKCNPSCTMMPDRGPTNVSPAVETKVCVGNGLSLQTPSPSCSQCTHDNCCAEWLGCFSDLQSDCVKLNECANDCWRLFPQ